MPGLVPLRQAALPELSRGLWLWLRLEGRLLQSTHDSVPCSRHLLPLKGGEEEDGEKDSVSLDRSSLQCEAEACSEVT